MPSFSVGYQYAQSVFYDQFNEVDFFVEDEDQENFYFCILKKLFPKIRFENIYPLRGKPHVIEHAKTNRAKRKSVYLLDKDFDDLLKRVHKQANVFYLDKYCIENFLLEEKAIIKFIIDEKPRLKEAKVKGELQFQPTKDKIIKQLSKPFALFYVAKKLEIHALKNTSHEPDCFCSTTDKCLVDEEKVSAYAKQVKNKATNQGLTIDLVNELNACSEIFELNRKSELHGKNVSGEFILCLFAHKISKSFNFGVPNLQSFVYRLAQECDFHSLHDLQEKINLHLKAA